MKSATTQLITFLNTSQQMIVADLYTFAVLKTSYTGSTLTTSYNYYRYCSFDSDITIGGNVFSSSGAIIERDRVRNVIGVEVDELQMKVSATSGMLIEGVPFMQACASGVLDGARVTVDRAYMNGSLVVQGTINVFSGRVSTVKTGRLSADVTVRSDLELLNVQIPRNLYQPACLRTLYDSGCGISRATYTKAGTVGSATKSQVVTTASAITATNSYYDMGALIFTSGALAGVVRTVKTYINATSSKTFVLGEPLPSVPAIGDSFKVYPGCDKTKNTCGSKFSNSANFRGMPFVPVPETMR